jgi:hypothetical protein
MADSKKKKDLAALLQELFELEVQLTPNQKKLVELKIEKPAAKLSDLYEEAGYGCDLSTASGKKIAYINAYKVLLHNEKVKKYGAILNHLAMDEKIAKIQETQETLTSIIRGEAVGKESKVVREGGGKDKIVEVDIRPTFKEQIAAARVLLKSQGAFVTKVETVGSGTVQFIVKEANEKTIKEEKDD